MFSLIITIISIALVAALALATIYYGGSAFNRGSAQAQASTLISQAQQIAAAEVLYANDHAGAYDLTASDATLSGLTSAPTYLTTIPAAPTAVAASGATYSVAASGT